MLYWHIIIYKKFIQQKITGYDIIHGDTNFSNILINPENQDIKFIDPRGYFSSSKIFGLVDYEYAKILYGISGYDHFNNHHFTIQSMNEKEIYFNIPNSVNNASYSGSWKVL